MYTYRHNLLDEPFSRSARWSARMGIFALPVLMIAFMVLRSSTGDTAHAENAVLAAGVLAAGAILLGLAALARIWISGWRGTRAALTGIVMGAVALVLPLWLLTQHHTLPALYDVSTDVGDAPQFQAVLAERTSGDLDVRAFSQFGAIRQLTAYPDVVSLTITVPSDEAFEMVKELVSERKWRVISVRDPNEEGEGSIEIATRAGMLAIACDGVIRVRKVNDETSRIDMRMATRTWRHDLGENAHLIAAFLRDVQQAARE